MATVGWVAELDEKEHRNWVMVGCALNITKNGIAPLIQGKMEVWYQSLISSAPLHSLPPCTCAPSRSKCGTCVTWETELKRLHKSGRPKICWDNSDRNQWGSPTGAWEIAKIFMPTLGTRTTHVVDADTTDIGGLLNLLEWCPFIHPPVSRTVLTSARDQCRNHWAHAPKQELQDADVNTIFGHLNSLLNDPVFSSEKDAQKSSKDLQDLFRHGLVNVIDSEVEALKLLRQSLVGELTKCRDDLDDVQVKVAELDKETKRVGEVQKDLLEVKEQGDLNREETIKLREHVRTEVDTARGELGRCKEDLIDVEDKVAQLDVEVKRIHESAKEDRNSSRAEVAKLKQQLQTEVKEVEADLNEKVSTILNTVEDFNILLSKRDDLRGVCDLISEDVEYLKREVHKVNIELATTKSQVSTLEIDLSNVNYQVQGLTNEVATNKTTISGLQKDVLEVKEEVETLKVAPVQGLNSADENDVLFTAPSRLTGFTGRDLALAWLEENLTPHHSGENFPGTSCCTKTICGLGGCGKTSLAVEFAWKCKNHFPGGVFWINGESDENINKSVVENLALLNITASTSEKVDDTLNRFSAFLSKEKHPWLLVVDNADELEDKTCPTGVKKICKGPWKRNGSVSKHGHILLTTRQTVKETRAFLKLSPDDCLELKCFSEEEGALFLMQRIGYNRKALHQEAIKLVNELGALPLALEQAAAYISALPIACSFKAYLEKYRAVKLSLMEQQPATALSTEAQYRLSVHTTWLMNFEFVREKSPAAATMMHIAAFLDSDNIPFDVINPGHPELEQVELRDSSRSEIDIAAILKVLSCYSLFSVDEKRRVFGVHKLVQEVVRDSVNDSMRTETVVAAIRVLHFAFFKNTKPCSMLGKYHDLGNLSETNEKNKNILVALLFNFRKLKTHIEEEINSSKGTFIDVLYKDDTFDRLISFVPRLINGNVFFQRLNAEFGDFRLKVAKMRPEIQGDPNFYLLMMVDASVTKKNCADPASYEEAKNLAQETVRKLYDLEKYGVIIEDNIKYKVFAHRASYYALEGHWKENYEELLKLESLKLSDSNIVDLQIGIGRAENMVSACNFQSAFNRYKKALALAMKIYPPDHHELVRVLHFIITLLDNEGKAEEARPYAEEMLEISKKQPRQSDVYIRGMCGALKVLNNFDNRRSEDKLLGLLEKRWPYVYNRINKGSMEQNEALIVDDGSDDHLAHVLETLLICWCRTKSNTPATATEEKRTGMVYLRIAQIVLGIRKKFYGENHPGLENAYIGLSAVHSILGNIEEAEKCQKLLNQCKLSTTTQPYQGIPPCDSKLYATRKIKDLGNGFFKMEQYDSALNMYELALGHLPNDPKLLSNKAATCVKLSEKTSGEGRQKFLERALGASQDAIKADPSWMKGYYWKAVSLAHLGERGPSLAAAAVAQHLFPSQCATIPAVENRFGSCTAEVVTTVQELLQATESRDTRNVVIVVKKGRYELSNPVKLQDHTVMVGLEETQITCSQGIPLKVNKTVYMENITLSPSIETVSMLKEKAKGCLNRGEVDEALSLYSEALNLCPDDPKFLTSRASTYLKCAEQKKAIPTERKSSLELALNDAEAAIRADSSWLLGYYTKALSLAELDRKQQALAAAAVFKHLSSGRDVPEITWRYGSLQIEVVKSSDQLCSVLQEMKNPDGVNQVILVKEGEYLLERTVEIPHPIIVIGQGKVKMSCKTGTPFHFVQADHVENIEMF